MAINDSKAGEGKKEELDEFILTERLILDGLYSEKSPRSDTNGDQKAAEPRVKRINGSPRRVIRKKPKAKSAHSKCGTFIMNRRKQLFESVNSNQEFVLKLIIFAWKGYTEKCKHARLVNDL